MLPPMSRRFQFSLRALLVVVTVGCLLLGGWHLLKTYGQYIEASGRLRAGERISVRGRIIRPFGPEELSYNFIVYGVSSNNGVPSEALSRGCGHWSYAYVAKRRWFCIYTVEAQVKNDFDERGGEGMPLGDYWIALRLGREYDYEDVAAGRLNVQQL